jgi:hypothetical protein
MRYLLPLLLLLLSGCAEDQYPDTPTLEGSWHRLMPFGPDWHYHFDGAQMRQTLQEPGLPLVDLEFPYVTRADSIFIGGNPERTWKIEFVGDSVLEVRDITPGLIIGEMYWLRKLPE